MGARLACCAGPLSLLPHLCADDSVPLRVLAVYRLRLWHSPLRSHVFFFPAFLLSSAACNSATDLASMLWFSLPNLSSLPSLTCSCAPPPTEPFTYACTRPRTPRSTSRLLSLTSAHAGPKGMHKHAEGRDAAADLSDVTRTSGNAMVHVFAGLDTAVLFALFCFAVTSRRRACTWKAKRSQQVRQRGVPVALLTAVWFARFMRSTRRGLCLRVCVSGWV